MGRSDLKLYSLHSARIPKAEPQTPKTAMIPPLPNIEFANPDFLWLGALLPLFWWWWRAGARSAVVFRSLIVVLLVVSLAQPQQVTETHEKSESLGRTFVFDLSRSIQPATRRWMLETARKRTSTLRPDRFFVFGGRALAADDWEEWLQGATVDPAVQPEKTNLAESLTQILADPSVTGSIYLFTDGWETEGNVRDKLPSLSRSAARIIPLVPPGGQEVANVEVTRILAPHEGESRARIKLKVVLHNMSGDPVKGKIIWKRDKRPWQTKTLTVEPGHQLRSYEAVLPEKGLIAYQATFIPDDSLKDTFDGDNQATAWVSVKAKERVLVFNGGAKQGRYLEAILRRQGFKVTAVGPKAKPPPPEKYAAVIFNNIPKRRVAQTYMERIRKYVANGGSFVMLGSNGSFGPGGYRKTPIAKVLPVELKEPKRKRKKTRGIVLVIDKSGSMRTDRKLAFAKEAAQALAQNLKNRDLLGVVGFDIAPFEVLPLESMATQRSSVAGKVARLKPGGKTYLYPALLLAKRMLERSPANLRHVIVLSDGETGGSGSDYMDLVSVMKQDLNITVSAVAIGDQANIPLLRRVALYGGGAFHHTFDPSTLPKILAGEVKKEPEQRKRRPKDFKPRLARRTNIFKGFPEKKFPPITGFVETKARKKADTDLFIPLPDGSRKPLVASWRYGKGKVVVFTTDLEGGWTRAWIRWRGLDRFWDRVMRWLAPKDDLLLIHEVRMNPTAGGTVMDLYIYGERVLGTFRYSVRGNKGERSGKFLEEAPGHYRAILPSAAPGSYRIEVTEVRKGKKRVYPPIGYTQAHDPAAEVPRDRFNFELLEMMARATGGQINAAVDAQTVTERVVRATTPLQMIPILAAAFLFLCEIFVRRLFLS